MSFLKRHIHSLLRNWWAEGGLMKGALLVSILVLAQARPAAAQATDPATQQLIQQLMNRIDSLEKRVAELEQERAAGAARPPSPPPAPGQPPTPGPAAVHEAHEQPPVPEVSGPEAQPVYPSLKIAGFSDIDFSANNLHAAPAGFQPQTLLGPHSGFEEGQFVLQLSSALSPKVTVFSELSLTARSDAGTGATPAPGFNPEVERIIIRYDVNDYFKLSFGRYHTPINYWNTAFHHGQWLQTTISRPEMVQFGGSFIPVHFVGGLLEGEAPTGGLHLNYDVGLGNGRGAVLSRAGDAGDVNNNRAWLVNLFAKPDKLFGLEIGGSAYRDKITVGGAAFDEWITAGHIVWHKENPELIAEIANVNHSQVGRPGGSNSLAYYVQFAYRLPGSAQLWKPYYRWEYIHIPQSDILFVPRVSGLAGSTVGVRYDITSFAAFKVEYRNQRRPGLPRINGAFAQTSFTF